MRMAGLPRETSSWARSNGSRSSSEPRVHAERAGLVHAVAQAVHDAEGGAEAGSCAARVRPVGPAPTSEGVQVVLRVLCVRGVVGHASPFLGLGEGEGEGEGGGWPRPVPGPVGLPGPDPRPAFNGGAQFGLGLGFGRNRPGTGAGAGILTGTGTGDARPRPQFTRSSPTRVAGWARGGLPGGRAGRAGHPPPTPAVQPFPWPGVSTSTVATTSTASPPGASRVPGVSRSAIVARAERVQLHGVQRDAGGGL